MRLVDFLSKDNVASGIALRNAEAAYDSQQKNMVINATLPKAWNRLISGPDDLLVDLIGETTESICGFRPDQDAVDRFLTDYAERLLISEEVHEPRTGKAPIVYKRADVRPSPYTGKTIIGFTFLGMHHEVRSWNEFLTSLVRIIYETHPDEFRKVLSLRGRKRVYFSRDANQLHEPKKVAGSGLYVETHWSADSTVRFAFRIISIFGYKERDVTIEAQ